LSLEETLAIEEIKA